MGLFSGISSASKFGGRSPFISRPGTTLCELIRFRSGENRAGRPFVQVDLKVLAILGTCVTSEIQVWNEQNPDKAMKLQPHAPGDLIANRTAVAAGDLRATHLGEIRAMTESAVESLVDGDFDQLEDAFGVKYDPDTGFGDEDLEALIEGLSSGDGTDAAGALFVVTSDPRVKVNKSGVYVVNGFMSGNAAAKEMVANGDLATPRILREE